MMPITSLNQSSASIGTTQKFNASGTADKNSTKNLVTINGKGRMTGLLYSYSYQDYYGTPRLQILVDGVDMTIDGVRINSSGSNYDMLIPSVFTFKKSLQISMVNETSQPSTPLTVKGTVELF